VIVVVVPVVEVWTTEVGLVRWPLLVSAITGITRVAAVAVVSVISVVTLLEVVGLIAVPWTVVVRELSVHS